MSKPVRILYCENNVDGTVGGSYYSLLYLVTNLNPAKYRPTVVFYTPHSLLPAFREAGVDTQVWKKAEPFRFGARLRNAPRVLTLPAVALQKALNVLHGFVLPALGRAWFLVRGRFRIVHLNNSVLYNHDWMLAARLSRTKCLTHERGINDAFPPMAKFFGRGLGAVICISGAVKRNMEQRGADFGNLVTIHNGLDPKAMRVQVAATELRARYGIRADQPIVGMIGNIKAWKGQETLVRAMGEVHRQCPGAVAMLVGDTSPADRDYHQMLSGLVSSLGLERQIVFAGFQKNVTDFLMLFDVMVHASVLPEPFGRVVLEAMACRKPVIGSAAGAIPEIVEEGETGLMFPPGDSERLAEAILKVIGNPGEAQRMGDNGYARLERLFHLSRNVTATERVYDGLLNAD